VRVTWWGHATATLELGGLRVLTDPLLTDRLAHLVRQDVPAPGPDARTADVAIVSHLHADHLHVPSLKLLPEACRIVAPRGSRELLTAKEPGLALRIVEVGEGDSVAIGAVTMTTTHAHHDGHRMPRSRHVGPALGFVLRADGETAWFAGDTGLFDGLAAVGPVDVALVPVGGWGPTLGPGHLDPEQAAEAVRRVGAAHAIPIHYGTFWPVGLRLARSTFRRRFLEPGERFAAACAVDVHRLAPGGTVTLPPDGAA
jgi:L-ascorbate metabolism protein UlaG (beta-lactamase superfamily)